MPKLHVLVMAIAMVVLATASTSAAMAAPWRTNATYFNDAALPAADPYVLHDPASGFYYAYSTEGADPGWYYAIYRSADLVTWEKLPRGALSQSDPKQWGNDWFWAPEVYYNPRTGLYFLFYAARSDANKLKWFGYADFEEPSKIGVAVARSPEGPFRNIAAHPIEWYPYDPDYHDVNLIMGPDQKKPPATLQAGEQAPLGTYIPTIDPNVFFAPDGHKYLYVSRNAYRNWHWDTDLGKYIEESDIIAVPLDDAWWNDPRGRTMPGIPAAYQGTNNQPGGPSGPRRDKYVQILSYDADKQAWENADVNDYALSGGEKKDRRWEEGSTTFTHNYRDAAGHRHTAYYLTYSANNWETPQYGVGYAVADGPLGPFRKAPNNPILSQNASIGMFSTGHGDIEFSPDGRQLYYVHHGRPTATDPQRRLYTDRMRFLDARLDVFGKPALQILQSTSDEPVPSGVAPYRLRASARSLAVGPRGRATLQAWVTAADGARLALENPLNRVAFRVANPGVVRVVVRRGGVARVIARAPGTTRIRLAYQRQRARGGYFSVFDELGGERRPVAATVRVRVRSH
jgi:Glycosyl hydrolases family 43